MSRVQLALNVGDLDASIAFYTKLFKTPPAKIRENYANFAIAEPPLKLVLIAGQVEDGAVVLGEDGFGVWVLMLGVQGFGWGGRLEGQAVVSLTACRAEDSSTMPVLAA